MISAITYIILAGMGIYYSINFTRKVEVSEKELITMVTILFMTSVITIIFLLQVLLFNVARWGI